jgi:peroxisomal 3,2-trans-enoyl-CoA isomerase
VLVIGLNGPAVGLSAAITGFADFIYITPQTFLLTPFSSLGLVAEGGASRALVQRLGPARANEALIMSKRITAEELTACGYANAVFDVGKGEDAKFRARVLQEVDERLGEHLVGESLTGIKKLIRRPEMDVLDGQNVSEVFAGLDRFVKGVPQEEFRKIATGEKRHKL